MHWLKRLLLGESAQAKADALALMDEIERKAKAASVTITTEGYCPRCGERIDRIALRSRVVENSNDVA